MIEDDPFETELFAEADELTAALRAIQSRANEKGSLGFTPFRQVLKEELHVSGHDANQMIVRLMSLGFLYVIIKEQKPQNWKTIPPVEHMVTMSVDVVSPEVADRAKDISDARTAEYDCTVALFDAAINACNGQLIIADRAIANAAAKLEAGRTRRKSIEEIKTRLEQSLKALTE